MGRDGSGGGKVGVVVEMQGSALVVCNHFGKALVPLHSCKTLSAASGKLTPWTTSPYSYISRYTEYIARYTKTSFLIIVYLEIYDYEQKL